MEVPRSTAAKGEKLEVIALISGGKDSFYSLLHCLANHYEVVALANLYPPTIANISDDQNDLNSYMYQTAGHALIPLYADVLGLPLYRQEIVGSATNSSIDYHEITDEQTPSTNTTTTAASDEVQPIDETESLLPLLRKIVQAHPNANAVCSGAIISTYQRTRIESAARRLNLTPLSYLWQYPLLPHPSPGILLDDMAAVDLDITIVKVASGGLDENVLGCKLLDPLVRKKLEKSVMRFGGSILGEGGEYETIVFDGPPGVFKGSIRLRQPFAGWTGRGGGGEAWLGYKEGAGEVVMKNNDASLDMGGWKKRLRIPGLWDPEFEVLLNAMLGFSRLCTLNFDMYRGRSLVTDTLWAAKQITRKRVKTLTLSNVTGVDFGTTASEQMLAIKSKLLDILVMNACPDTDNIVFTTILLRSMTDFAAVNQVYGQIFTSPNPPARVTLACGDTLPPGVEVMVSFVVDLGSSTAREGLHVQSRSYWAPANIGPYSQAISVPRVQKYETSLIYVAGQIPLVPASMEGLYRDKNELKWNLFQKQTCLALQHLWRIGRAMSVSWWTGAVAFIIGQGNLQLEARFAWETWAHAHHRGLWKIFDVEDDGLDAWDRKYGGMSSLVPETANASPLPDFEKSPYSSDSDIPGFFAVQVDELPRGCTIEWQSLGITRPMHTVWYGAIMSNEPDQGLRTKLLEVLVPRGKGNEDVHVTVYTCRPAVICDLDVQIVPCRAVWGQGGVSLAAGVVIHLISGDRAFNDRFAVL